MDTADHARGIRRVAKERNWSVFWKAGDDPESSVADDLERVQGRGTYLEKKRTGLFEEIANKRVDNSQYAIEGEHHDSEIK